ncbi:MAG: M20/M25/M40 family metallo-hydrolase [Desulfobacterales bacterium]|nr:M20/M25/M40 family metallo-hydrolase [Desulfobacterales bacterium]
MADIQKTLDEARLKAFARELIRTPSLSMEEEAISRIVESEMKSLGYDEVRVDDLFNVVGVIKGSGTGPTLLFNGHIDHAGVGSMKDPFSAEVIDGRDFGHDGPVIYGRGACDMKGAVAAMVHAGAMIKQAGVSLSGDILVTCVAREEMAKGEGIRRLLENGLTADFAVSGEATSLQVYVGHRGKFEAKVTTRGRTSHGGYPQGGVNAIFKMNAFFNALQSDYPLPNHDFLGKATVTALDINASPGALTPIVPDRCEAVIDRRFFPEESEESLLEGFRQLFAAVKEQDPEFEAEIEPLKWFPAMFTDPDEAIVQSMISARRRILGEPGEIGAWYFGVDGTFINQAGIPCVGLGPGNEYLAHTPRDVVPVRDLMDAARIYAALIEDVCR